MIPAQFDYTAPDFSADRYHGQLAQVRAQGWLARPLWDHVPR